MASGTRYHDHLAAALIILGVATRLPLLPTPLTYLNDAWREADTASVARHIATGEGGILNPKIYWGGDGPGYVETEFQLYPFLVAMLYAPFGEQLWFGRLVSLLFSAGAMAGFYSLARRILRPTASIWALGFFIASPVVVRYSVAYMPEAPLLCFYVLGLSGFCDWLQRDNRRSLWLGAACTAVAILLKPTAMITGLIIAPLAIKRHGLALLTRRDVWLAIAICLLPGFVWYLHAHDLYVRYGNTFGVAVGGDTKWGGPSYWLSWHFYYATVKLHTKWLFAIGGAVLYLIGLLVVIRRRNTGLLMAGTAAICIYCFLLARAVEKFYSVHYYILAAPIAAIGVGMGMDAMLNTARGRRLARVAALILAATTIAYSGYIYTQRFSRDANAFALREIDCAAHVAQIVPAEQRIIVSSVSPSEERGRPRAFPDPIVFFYSHRYGWSVPIDQHTPETIESLRSRGATYLICCSERIVTNRPDFANYLADVADQVGPDLDAGCGIYRFHQQIASR